MQVQEQKQQNVMFGKFDIFLIMKSAQNNYGVKNGDYARYRNYCSRKIQKLRKAMNIKYGNRTKFVRRDIINDHYNDNRVLQVLLFHVEKFWAQANECKFDTGRNESQKSRIRFFAMKKFHRAFEWAKKLEKLCQQKTDQQTKLQSKAYELLMQGYWLFQSQKWSGAQSQFIACRQILTDRMKNCDSITERIYHEKIDQIDQNIKYCNFKLEGKQMNIGQIIAMKKTGDANLSQLMQQLTQKKLQSVSLQENKKQIKFDNERYPIKSEQLLLQKQKIDISTTNIRQIKKKLQANLEDQKMYEQLLFLYSQTIVLIEEAIKITDKQKEDSNKYTQGQAQILKKVSLLFQQIKLQQFIDRSETIFIFSYEQGQSKKDNKKSSPQTLAKLLSNMTSFYNQLIEIQKQKGQISNSLQPEKIQAIDGQNFYIRTVRLALVGKVYFNNDKIKQASSLWGQCERCLKVLQQNENMEKRIMSMEKIKEIVRLGRLQCLVKYNENQQKNKKKLNNELGDLKVTEPQKTNTNNLSLDIILREKITDVKLEQMSQIPIIDLPGDIQPIPPRPIFLNLFDYETEYPKIDKKSQNQSGSWWKKFFN